MIRPLNGTKRTFRRGVQSAFDPFRTLDEVLTCLKANAGEGINELPLSLAIVDFPD
jgi:hypothetical protein